jgi:hypothetical protein
MDMNRIAGALAAILCLAPIGAVHATLVTGKVRSESGTPIAFASVSVKGGTQGTTSNAEGDYRLDLPPGSYLLLCGHVGYQRQEIRVTVSDKPLTRDFTLRLQELTLGEVRVRPGGEDPAYAIIRSAIRTREFHRTRIDSWNCDAYVKGLLRLGGYPRSFMGQKVEFEDGDTTRKERILYLAETIARVRYRKNEGQRVDVISTRVSGRSDAFGLGSPQPVSFYEENVRISSALNPRGFVSPIADNALYFYRYRYQGAFSEDGRLVNRIQVIPKRPYEPLFQGYIQIVEDDWNIHSVDLTLGKTSQMEFLDTLVVQQTYAPVRGGVYMLQSQTLLPVFRQFGFQANGHFITVFSNYEMDPAIARGGFGRTILKYDTGSNRRPADYWDRIRPIPLLPEEQLDYSRGDSLEQRRRDPAYLDSLDRRQNRVSLNALLLTGQSFVRRKDSIRLSINPLINNFGFNTVEGWMARLSTTLSKDLPGRRSLSFNPVLRHGFGNGRTNLYATLRYRYGTALSRDIRVAGGRRVLQFNEANPVHLMSNTFNTLLYGNNFLKIYESAFADVSHTAELKRGFTLQAGIRYQSRHLLQNTDTATFWRRDVSRRRYTPNLPAEASAIGMPDHQALLASLSLTWRPGTRYIEFPDRTLSLSGRAPVFNVSYTQGIRALGSDVDFGRWRISVRDDVRLGLAGTFRYRLGAGGFLHIYSLQYPDYRHFNGNQVLNAGEYLNTFQLARYYELATRDRLYAEIHAEHDFGGAITNKVPVIRKLNLRLIAGTNALFTRQDGNYWELFAGIDNILKILRIDAILARDREGLTRTGIRLGIRGIDVLLEED